ncbi:MAG: UvrD-helicase domain-containing protein, partial [Bacillota bacterium]
MKKVLKASAGTGKTYRLSLEYLASLLKGENYTDIAVLTFTRKATAEARERILEHLQTLEEKGKKSDIWKNLSRLYPDLSFKPQVVRSCRRQMLLHKDVIQIYTIDSFINSIFQEVVAPCMGIYNYEIIEGEGNEEAVEEIFRRLLQQEKYFSLMEQIFQFKVDRDFEEILNYMETMLEDRWKYLLLQHHNQRDLREEKSFIQALDECLLLLEEVAEMRGEEIDSSWFISGFTSEMTNYLRMKDQNRKREDLLKNILKNRNKFLKKGKTFWNGNKLRGKKYKVIKENLEAQYEVFQERVARYIFNKELLPLEKQLFKLAEVVFEEYDKLKHQQKKFTHSDISNYVYKYIVMGELEFPEGDLSSFLSRFTGEEIKSLFIDEFQDTSVLQWKILENMLSNERNFIAVGDAKQSIYQWRGGEKELFIRLPELIDCPEETLPVCYRSDESVLDFINSFYLNLNKDWEYERVEPHPEAGQGYVEVVLGGGKAKINEETKKFSKLDEVKQESIIRQNNKVKTNLSREIAGKLEKDFNSYEDVAVLARRNKDLKEIAAELAEKNIPYIMHQEGELLENEAVWPLYQLLRYFWRGEYPNLLNFLRSDLVQVSHSSLKFMLRERKKIEKLLNPEAEIELPLAEKDLFSQEKKLARVLEWIIQLREYEYKEMVYSLIAESGLLNLTGKDRGILKNVFRFYQLLRKQESLADFMEFCREESESSLLKETSVQGENAVDLLTVHKAKGLSFHSVFFYWKPSARRGGNYGKGDLNFCLRFDDKYDNIEEYLLFPTRYQRLMPWLDFTFQEEMEESELAEEINNVYVAMTRAVHNLFLLVETPVQIEPGEENAWGSKDNYGFYETALKNSCEVNSLSELITGKIRGQFISPETEEADEVVDKCQVVPFFQPEKTA